MAQVMRTAQKVDFGTPREASGVQDRTSYVNPDFAKYEGSKGRVKTATDVEVSDSDYLLAAIGAAATTKGRQMFKDSAEEAWLSGQAAAAAGKSKDEVETNIFTRAWANEGWSDTKARLSLSDADVRTAADMVKLREQDPEKMKEYLKKRRDGLMPLMDGMSMEARKGMVAQMVLSDQHAIAKHQTEYSKFVIDQQAAAITTSHTVANQAMNAAKGDPAAYDTATDAALGNLYSTVIMNPNLPARNKQELLTQAAQLSLTNNHQQLYEKMRDTKDPQGRTMLEALPFDEQTKLAKAYQASRAETSAMRDGKYMEQLGLYTAQLDDKDSPPVTWAEHQRFIQEGVQLGVISKDKIAELSNKWGDAMRKKSIEGNVAQMVIAGDAQGMFRANVTPEKAWDAYINVSRKQGKSLADTTAGAVQVAVATGQTMGFQKVGELMGPSIQAAFRTPDGKVDPAKLEGLNTVLKTIEQFDGTSNRGAKTAFLAAFDEDTQNLVTNYMHGLRTTGSSSVAASQALTIMTDTAAMTPAQRAAASNFKAAEVTKTVNELTPKGLFARTWEAVVPDMFRSKDNVAKDKLRVAKSWSDDADMVEAAAVPARLAVLSAADRINRANPGMSSEGVITRALTEVSSRTVLTAGGPLVIPEGQTIQSFFGVERSVDADVVGSALSSMHKAAPGNRTFYNVAADGRMVWEERDASTGARVRGAIFDPREVANAARAEQDKRTKDFAETDGPGRTVTGSDGSSVRYNGENTIGLGTKVVVQARNDLVKHEQVRLKPYEDASGKIVNGKKVMTVGVGVSSHNPYYPPVQPDGTVLQADIDRSFRDASNAALKTANEYVQELPRERQGAPAIRLLTSLSYQGGSVKPEVRQALAGSDKAAALAAIKATPQYKMAHKERKDYYEEMTNAVMNSNIINRN